MASLVRLLKRDLGEAVFVHSIVLGGSASQDRSRSFFDNVNGQVDPCTVFVV